MLRKNKMLIIGKDENNHLVCMNSNTIYRNFAPENYINMIIDEIHHSDVPDFESPCAYNFGDKVVKFEDIVVAPVAVDETTKMFMLGSTTDKKELYDYAYFVNTSDVFIKIDLTGDCLSDTLRVRKMNLAPRSIMVLKLDRAEAFNVEREDGVNKKVFYKNTSDLTFNLEYNIYMTRLL